MEKKTCKVCGRELPISEFQRNHLSRDGYTDTCKRCRIAKYKETRSKDKDDCLTPPHKNGGNPDLAPFTPRELIEELKARGYTGKLSIVREVII